MPGRVPDIPGAGYLVRDCQSPAQAGAHCAEEDAQHGMDQALGGVSLSRKDQSRHVRRGRGESQDDGASSSLERISPEPFETTIF